MGLQVTPPPAAVSLDDLGTIKGDALKGVDSDKYVQRDNETVPQNISSLEVQRHERSGRGKHSCLCESHIPQITIMLRLPKARLWPKRPETAFDPP